MHAGLLLSIALTCQVPVGTSDVDLAARVRLLVLDFDAAQRMVRDAAEAKLVELGVAVLPHLPAPGTGASAEVELRVNRVRAALYRRRVEQSLQASLVDFHFDNVPLKDAFAAIETQTGNQLIDYRRQFGQLVDDIRVTQTAKGAFWPIFDGLLNHSRLEVYHFAGTDGLAIVSAPATSTPGAKPPIFYGGAFRVEARRLIVTRNFAGGESQLQIDMFVDWEPRLKPMFFTVAAAKSSAVDAEGRDLEPLNPDAVREIAPAGKAARIELSLGFRAPARQVQSLRSLQGMLDVLLPAEMHEFRFAHLGGDVPAMRVAAATVVVAPPIKFDDAWEVPLRLQYENAGNALESHRAWFYKNPTYFEAADGTRTTPAAVELVGQSANEISLKLRFSSALDWSRQTFVYQAPADIVTLPIAYEFRDLPLP